jgi:hypothetical protein
MALYGTGSPQHPTLYTLYEDGSAAGGDLNIYPGAVASRDGRWVASPGSLAPAGSVVIADLLRGTHYTIAATEGWGVSGLAFDPQVDRLAFLELAPAQVQNIPWAIVVVDLSDGSTTRFEDTTLPAQDSLPGDPLGWAAAGDTLLLATRLPYTDGRYAGIVAVELPPGTKAAPLDDLEQQELIPGGVYLSTPDLSPDGTRLVYLARDPSYVPADYEPAEDFAVNQLWTFDLDTGEAAMLYQVTDGDALAQHATWSPDGQSILFAQGYYQGMYWRTLGLRRYSGVGEVTEVAPLPLPESWVQLRLHWCRPDTALVTMETGVPVDELYSAGMEAETLELVASEGTVFVLGCIFGSGL